MIQNLFPVLVERNATSCEDGQIRLQGGVIENEGRVEICFGNVWGTICDDDWDSNDAAVVCRELGYSDGEGEWCMHLG